MGDGESNFFRRAAILLLRRRGVRTSRAAGRRGRINRHDRTDRIGDIVVGQSAGGAQNGGRDLETTFGRHAGIKCYRTADCRLYIPCGDQLIAFPDRQHEPSGGRKSLSKMRLVPLSREEGPSVQSMDPFVIRLSAGGSCLRNRGRLVWHQILGGLIATRACSETRWRTSPPEADL